MSRIGPLVWVAFFLLGGAWAVALPINGTYDENQHIVRAYAAVTGQWLPTRHATDAAGLPSEAFDAPRSLLPKNAACTYKPKPPKPASCQIPETDRSHTSMPSQAARYSPVYYLLVGLPLRISPDENGVIFARLLSMFLSAGLLAAAVVIAIRLRHRLLLAAIILVSTPTVMNLCGAINPNGMEIAAGILLCVALSACFLTRDDLGRQMTLWCLAAAGVSSVLLITIRDLGPLFFVCMVVACLALSRRQWIMKIVRSRAGFFLWQLPVVASVIFVVLWKLTPRGEESVDSGYPYSTWEILRRLPEERMRFYIDQVVGRFSYGETTVSPLMIISWYVLFAIVVIPALWLARARLRYVVGAIFVVCSAILVYGEVHYVPLVTWFSHSRYVMPLGVGIVLFSAFSDGFRIFMQKNGWSGNPVTLLIVATVPLDMYALIRVMTRFQVGIEVSFDPLGGSWHPAYGSLIPLVLSLLGGLGLFAVALVTSSMAKGEEFSPTDKAVPPVTERAVRS